MNVVLTVTENNTGSEQLTDPFVVLNPGNMILTRTTANTTANFTSGDLANTGILDPGETWTWTVTGVPVTAPSTQYTAIGHGLDPLLNDITYSAYPNERAQVTVRL